MALAGFGRRGIGYGSRARLSNLARAFQQLVVNWLAAFPHDPPILNDKIQSREHNEGEQCRGDEAADNDHRQWLLHFRSNPVGKRHRQEPKHRQQRGHQDGAETHEGTQDNRSKKPDISRRRHRGQPYFRPFDDRFQGPRS